MTRARLVASVVQFYRDLRSGSPWYSPSREKKSKQCNLIFKKVQKNSKVVELLNFIHMINKEKVIKTWCIDKRQAGVCGTRTSGTKSLTDWVRSVHRSFRCSCRRSRSRLSVLFPTLTITVRTYALFWEGSTTVVYTVVWRNPVVWWGGWNTALWLVTKCIFLYVLSMNYQAMGSSSANHIAVFHPPHQTTGFRQTTV